MMPFLRGIAIFLPQILISLLLAGANDMLGGWNQTDDAMFTVVALFFLSPIAALALLTTEIVKGYRASKKDRTGAFLFILLGVFLLAEALAIDYYFLSQLRM